MLSLKSGAAGCCSTWRPCSECPAPFCLTCRTCVEVYMLHLIMTASRARFAQLCTCVDQCLQLLLCRPVAWRLQHILFISVLQIANLAKASCVHCTAGHRCVQGRCVVPQALPIPLPFPRIFKPSVLRYGDLAVEDQQPSGRFE